MCVFVWVGEAGNASRHFKAQRWTTCKTCKDTSSALGFASARVCRWTLPLLPCALASCISHATFHKVPLVTNILDSTWTYYGMWHRRPRTNTEKTLS